MASAGADDGELALLDRVLFRMGMAETDAALEEAVHKFLAPSLLKVPNTVPLAYNVTLLSRHHRWK